MGTLKSKNEENRQPSDPLALLQDFGLTRQESTIYLALLGEGSMNGYEVAKSLGLSRSNAYTALASLVDKGASWTEDGSPVRYAAVPAAEFTDNSIHRLTGMRARLLACLPARKESLGGYVTIRGSAQILDRLRHLILETEERLYLSLDSRLLVQYRDEDSSDCKSGKKLVVVTARSAIGAHSLAREFPGAELHGTDAEPAEIRAIADSRFVLTGDMPEGSVEASCLFSDARNLVELFKSALKNEILLADLANGKGAFSSGSAPR